MQLIFDNPPTEDYKIKMSTQAEGLMNGDIIDINIGNDLADNKENKLTFDDGSLIRKEINDLASDVTKEAILMDENYHENNTNGNENDEGDVITMEGVEECDLLENINNIIGENSTSGANNRQEENSCKKLDDNISVTDPANASEEDCLKADNATDISKYNSDEEVNSNIVNTQIINSLGESDSLKVVNSIDMTENTEIKQIIQSSLAVKDNLKVGISNCNINILEDSETSNNTIDGELISHSESSASIINHAKENIKLIDKENDELLKSREDDVTIIGTDKSPLAHAPSSVNDIENIAVETLDKESYKPTSISVEDADNLETNSFDGPSLQPLTNTVNHAANMDTEIVKPLEFEDANLMHDKNECAKNDRIFTNSSLTLNVDNSSIHDEKRDLSHVLEDNTISSDGNADELTLVYETSPTHVTNSDNETSPASDAISINEDKDESSYFPENNNSTESNIDNLSIVNETPSASDVNSMDGKEGKSLHLPEVNDVSTESNTHKESPVIEDPEDLPMQEGFEKTSILDTSVSSIDEKTTLNEETDLENQQSKTSTIQNSQGILIEAEVIQQPEIPAAVVVNDEVVTNDIDMHEPEAACVDKIKKEIIAKIDNIVKDDEKTLPITETEDTVMIENSETQLVEDKALKNNINEESANNTVTCAEKELVNAEKGVENVCMEVDDDDEIVDFDNDNSAEKFFNIDTSSKDLVDSEKNLESKDSSGNTINVSETKLDPATKVVETKDIGEDLIENSTTELSIPKEPKEIVQNDQDKVEIVDEDDLIVENKENKSLNEKEIAKSPESNKTKTLPVVCKLSNTLDILSDDEDEAPKEKTDNNPEEKQCINIDDDDDIMFIEEEDDSNSKEAITENKTGEKDVESMQSKPDSNVDIETSEKETNARDIEVMSPKINEKDLSPVNDAIMELDTTKKATSPDNLKSDQNKPLLPRNFLKTAKKNLADMTRDELEDFCILRIVESIVDRSNLGDIKTKIKTMTQTLEDYRKRALMLTKQNRDLQVVLKSVQEEQKKRSHSMIQPLKITRSVGMQVLMNDKVDTRRKGPIPSTPPVGRPARNLQNKNTTKNLTPPAIPVPRKVPVNSPAKALTNTPNNIAKTNSPSPNGIRNPSPVQKAAEKRTHSRMQSSVTVDLTDDEPPPKINNKNAPSPPVRVVPQQNLMAQQRFSQPLNSPRKVYIPISGPQAQNIKPGQTLMMRNIVPSAIRQRVPPMPKMQQGPIRINKPVAQVPNRHPAPLPDAMKQYTPPTWKSLPPAPDLKLSKVENGIVISWKIDGYPDGGYETIASYQLYAYQETSAPPSTALWKKIGDVKALPLPMACTLTQFMAGFKYYFAVRAVDVRSRLGPFSLPGSILLLNKV